MPKSELSSRYYLQHALEMFTYLETSCQHLLDDDAQQYLARFHTLNQDQQCMLMRVLTRKPNYLKRSTLNYPEITNPNHCLAELSKLGFIKPVDHSSLGESFFSALTKVELIAFLAQVSIRTSQQLKKAQLVELCTTWLEGNPTSTIGFDVYQLYVERLHIELCNYMLFLFFGDLYRRFETFTMRDLGVLRTKGTQNKERLAARFDSREVAENEFKCHLYKRKLKQGEIKAEQLIPFLESYSSNNSPARAKLVVRVGESLAPEDSLRAQYVWSLSDHPQALEKQVRLRYASGDKEGAKAQLEVLRESSLAASSQIFVEDFYTRKYLGKRTSIYTDMLNNANPDLELDEAYINSAERGAIAHYEHAGDKAWHVENELWRACFALLFWDLLFDHDTALATEFDNTPLVLQNGQFYAGFKERIESRLAGLERSEIIGRELTALVVQKHGFPTGLFRWSSKLLETLLLLIKLAPKGALAQVMRRMAKDYHTSKDGYPDLMVVANQQLTFVEVKAPGDTLRPNQLVSINRLIKAGFAAEIQPVRWAVNPQQTYSVVDIETTGGRQSGNAITEIAIVTVRNSKIIEEWSTLIKPDRLIPAHITRLTGISNAMVVDAPVFAEIADELKQRLHNSIFVAHNVGFDYGFIKAAYQRLNQSFKMPRVCTVRASRKSFPGLSSYSLGNLVRHFDIELKNHHRALDDARATAYLLKLIHAERENNIGTIPS